MRNKTKVILIGAAVASAAAFPAIARAGNGTQAGDTDSKEIDRPITGADLERASAAALAHMGEGRVTGTEIEDEESYYEIEVTLDNGRQVDVQLDEDFNVVASEPDSEND